MIARLTLLGLRDLDNLWCVFYTDRMNRVILIAHDIRSTHNVGSLLRTAECMGVTHTYLTGYTPYPTTSDDQRLPHISRKLTEQIHKTALGAETMTPWSHEDDVTALLTRMHAEGFLLVGLEQSTDSVLLPSFNTIRDVALLIGREVEGIDETLLQACDITIEIPQFGAKESLNVVQATAIALYQLRTIGRTP